MPTFNTTQFNAQRDTRTNTSRLAQQNVSSGEVEFAVIDYTLSGSEATGDFVNLCILPADVTPVPALSAIISADPGTTLVIDVGTAADPDGWADGVVMSSGGQVAFNTPALSAWNAPTQFVPDAGSGNTIVFATLTSVSSPTANVVVRFLLAYKRNK